ncbi:MAG: hypothetical protein Q9163_003502 [Psora crenata]
MPWSYGLPCHNTSPALSTPHLQRQGRSRRNRRKPRGAKICNSSSFSVPFEQQQSSIDDRRSPTASSDKEKYEDSKRSSSGIAPEEDLIDLFTDSDRVGRIDVPEPEPPKAPAEALLAAGKRRRQRARGSGRRHEADLLSGREEK